MIERFSSLGMRRRFSFWPAVLVGIVVVKAFLSLAIKPGSWMAAYSGVAYFLLLGLTASFAIRSGVVDITARKRAENELRESEDRYRDLVETLPDAIFVVSEERILFVNRSAMKLLGARQSEQIVGKNISEVVHPASLESIRRRMQDSHRTGVATPPMEHTLIALDGSQVEIESASIPITWEGSPATEAIARDVRERKRAEARLREYEQALEGLEEMIVVVDRQYRLVLANRAYLNYRGMQREQVVGHLVPELSGQGVFETVVKNKLNECFQGKVLHYELKHKYPDTIERDLLISYFPIDDGDGVDRVVSVLQDVTERKRAEKALSRLAAIVAFSDDAIISKDLNGVITSWNAGAERMFGYTEAEAVGQRITIIVPPELLDEEARILQRLRADEHIEHYETSRLTKARKRVDVSLTISPMKDSEGRVVGASKIARDITERKQAEEALRRSEAKAKAQAEELAAILDAVPGMALISRDPRAQKITGSRVAYEWLRLSYGSNISKSAPEGDRPSNFRIIRDGRELPPNELPIQKAAATGQVVRESELTLLFEDGAAREMFGNAAPLLNDEGVVRGAVGVFVDVSGRKRAEKSLKLFRTLLDQSNDFIYVIDPETLRFVDVNDRTCVSLGYTREELLSMKVQDVDPNANESLHTRVSDELKASGSAIFESLHRRKDGSTFPVEVSVKQVSLERVYTVTVARDITERKRAEQTAQEWQKRLELAQKAGLRIGLWDWDMVANTVVWSDETCRQWGFTRDAFSGRARDAFPRIHPKDRLLVEDAIQGVRGGGSEFSAEYRILRPDGTTCWIDAHGVVIRPGARMIGIGIDVTDQKKGEQSLQEAQAELARVARIVTLGELTASIAHEINQPLAAAVTNAGASLHWLAVQPPNLAEAREAMAGVMQEANRASSVIQRIRTLLQKSSPEMRRIDVNEVIREVLALTHSELLKCGVTVSTNLSPDVPAVLGDRVQLQQVILNLIMNAIDAMISVRDGPRTLRIESEKDPEGVLIEVQDSGKGINLENMPRIFDSFFTTKADGLGMGLSISRSIVEAHCGRLWAKCRHPCGAVFALILPGAETDA